MGTGNPGEREQGQDGWYDVYDEIPLIVVINSRYSGNRDFIDKIKMPGKTTGLFGSYALGDQEEAPASLR